jgi:Tol biopolymer transport system component
MFLSTAWSPDGTTIAFVRHECPADEHAPYCLQGRVQLETMTVADAEPIVVADQAGDLAWSPDGRRITFGNASGLFVVDADGSQLAKVAEGHVLEPKWSPDGEWLVFSTYHEATFSSDGPWIVAADGGEQRLLGPYGGWAW